jgi:precorrin-4/cobalt-precorrin-4 C11-methyltransferase
MKHRIYFIGAGPGGFEHLTLYGLEKLKKSKFVFAPNIYRKTYEKLLKGKKVFEPFDYLFDEMIDLIEELRKKSSVAFLLPGDDTVFSPFQPFIDYYKNECEVIPGVGVINCASAILKKTLDLPNVANTIVLTSTRSLKSTFEDHNFMQFVQKDVTLVLYMNHIPLEELTKRLVPVLGKECPISILYKISLPEQEVVSGNLGNICKKVKKDYFNSEKEPSMAMIIIGYVLKKRATKSSWDYRKKHIWDKRKK